MVSSGTHGTAANAHMAERSWLRSLRRARLLAEGARERLANGVAGCGVVRIHTDRLDGGAVNGSFGATVRGGCGSEEQGHLGAPNDPLRGAGPRRQRARDPEAAKPLGKREFRLGGQRVRETDLTGGEPPVNLNETQLMTDRRDDHARHRTSHQRPWLPPAQQAADLSSRASGTPSLHGAAGVADARVAIHAVVRTMATAMRRCIRAAQSKHFQCRRGVAAFDASFAIDLSAPSDLSETAPPRSITNGLKRAVVVRVRHDLCILVDSQVRSRQRACGRRGLRDDQSKLKTMN